MQSLFCNGISYFWRQMQGFCAASALSLISLNSLWLSFALIFTSLLILNLRVLKNRNWVDNEIRLWWHCICYECALPRLFDYASLHWIVKQPSFFLPSAHSSKFECFWNTTQNSSSEQSHLSILFNQKRMGQFQCIFSQSLKASTHYFI